MPRNEVYYEWCIEYVDQYGDIQDNNHSDTLDYREDDLKEALAGGGVEGKDHSELVLIRNISNEHEGVVDRSWAYVKKGSLPEFFSQANDSDGEKVPQRFHRELRTRLKNLSYLS
jgi:hypothetical protein